MKTMTKFLPIRLSFCLIHWWIPLVVNRQWADPQSESPPGKILDEFQACFGVCVVNLEVCSLRSCLQND